MMKGSSVSVEKYLFGELIGDVIYAPVWWYSRGFLKLLGGLKGRLVFFERSLGLRLWITTLGKPMYGQYDIAGKLISFFMRLAVLFWKIIIFLFYCLFLLLVILAWLVVPIWVVWQIVFQFTGLLIG